MGHFGNKPQIYSTVIPAPVAGSILTLIEKLQIGVGVC